MWPCSVHLSTHRYPVHRAHVHESPTHSIAGSAALNPRGHMSCITDTYPGYPYHVCRIHLLCTCHSHTALTCVHGSYTLMYLFRFLSHTDTLGGPAEPPWVGLGGWRSERQGLDPHRTGEKVAPGFTAGGQEIIVDTKPKRPLSGPGNQACPGFGLTA